MGDRGAILMIYSICFISNSSSQRTRSVFTEHIDWSTWFPQYFSTWFPILYLKEEHLGQLLKIGGSSNEIQQIMKRLGKYFCSTKTKPKPNINQPWYFSFVIWLSQQSYETHWKLSFSYRWNRTLGSWSDVIRVTGEKW